MKFLQPRKAIVYLPLVFILIVFVRIMINYHANTAALEQFTYKQASTLKAFMSAHRAYYLNLYEKGSIPLNEESLKGLPAFSSYPIMKQFSEYNALDIRAKTVSDRARNPLNSADAYELKAIRYFKENPKAEEYYVYEEGFYQYATPLRITQPCLTCHGTKEKAPDFIQKRYSEAYDYTIGDLRGIVSVQVPFEQIKKEFDEHLFENIFYNLLLSIGVVVLVLYLLRYFNSVQHMLEAKVAEKTKTLQNSVALLESYKCAIDNASSVSKTDKKGIITYVNDAFCLGTGYTKEELLGKAHSMLRHPDQPAATYKQLWQTILAKQTWRGIIQNRRKDDSSYWIDATITPILNERQEIVEFIAIRHDVSQIIEQQQTLQLMATTHALTGCFNRLKLLRDIANFNAPCLLLLDIDNFSQINDFYGYEMGDALLQEVAGYLVQWCNVNPFCQVYHLQADVFAILSSDVARDIFLERVYGLIENLNSQTFTCNHENIRVNFTASITCENASDLFKTATMAMQMAKKEHKTHLLYTESLGLDTIQKNNLIWTQKIRDALEKDNIVPYFQLISDNAAGAVVKYEALMRMIDDGKVVTPFYFLEIAKQTKLYTSLTKRLMTKVFESLKGKTYEVSINITLEDICSLEIKEHLSALLQEYPIGSQIIFEIVESEGIQNFDEVIEFIAIIRTHGCRIAIDDFGTGYSNFTYLMKLDPDFIKIDGSLIKTLLDEQSSRNVVVAIVDFAKKMGIKTVAEFVENESLQSAVVELGIEFSQGYLHGKPTETL